MEPYIVCVYIYIYIYICKCFDEYGIKMENSDNMVYEYHIGSSFIVCMTMRIQKFSLALHIQKFSLAMHVMWYILYVGGSYECFVEFLYIYIYICQLWESNAVKVGKKPHLSELYVCHWWHLRNIFLCVHTYFFA